VAGGKSVPVGKVLLYEAKEAACDFSSQDRVTRHVPLQGSACHARIVANLAGATESQCCTAAAVTGSSGSQSEVGA
jgi:hypothetical protein